MVFHSVPNNDKSSVTTCPFVIHPHHMQVEPALIIGSTPVVMPGLSLSPFSKALWSEVSAPQDPHVNGFLCHDLQGHIQLRIQKTRQAAVWLLKYHTVCFPQLHSLFLQKKLRRVLSIRSLASSEISPTPTVLAASEWYPL